MDKLIKMYFFLEEIFSSNSAIWFSKQGNQVAYASFNDSLVPTMQIPYYGAPGNLKYQYTSIISIHYPKVSFQQIQLSFHEIVFIFSIN